MPTSRPSLRQVGVYRNSIGKVECAAEIAEPLQDGDATLALLSDFVDVRVQFFLICGHTAFHNLNACRRVVADGGKRLGKLMRKCRHHLAERGQPRIMEQLRLAKGQLLLGPHSIRDVDIEAEELGCPARSPMQDPHCVDRDLAAIAAYDFDFFRLGQVHLAKASAISWRS